MSVAVLKKESLTVEFLPDVTLPDAPEVTPLDLAFAQIGDSIFLEVHNLKAEQFLSDCVGVPDPSDLFGARVLTPYQGHKLAALAISEKLVIQWRCEHGD